MREFTIISGIENEAKTGFGSISVVHAEAQSAEEAVLGLAMTEVNDSYPFLAYAGYLEPAWQGDKDGLERAHDAAVAHEMLAANDDADDTFAVIIE